MIFNSYTHIYSACMQLQEYMQCHLVPIVEIHGMADFAVGKHGMARVYVATTTYTSTHAVTIYLVYWPMNPPPMAMRQNLTMFT